MDYHIWMAKWDGVVKKLLQKPNAKILCPFCGQRNLTVDDYPYDGSGKLETWITCDACNQYHNRLLGKITTPLYKNNRFIYRLKNIHDKYKRQQLFFTKTAQTYEEAAQILKTIEKYNYKKRPNNL